LAKYPKGHRLYSTEFLRQKRIRRKHRRQDAFRKRALETFCDEQLVHAPAIMALMTPRDHAKVCAFLKRVRQAATQGVVNIDFSNVLEMKANAAVLLYATIDTIKSTQGVRFRLHRGGCPQQVYKLLLNSGLLALSSNHSDPIPEREIPIRAGDSTEAGQKVWNDIVDFILDRMGEFTTEEEIALSNAVSEAVLNVRHHAYPELSNEPDQMRWWIIADFIDDQLFLAILDKGVGIHETLPHQEWWRNAIQETGVSIKGLTGGSHSAWIGASFIEGKTRTRQDERGLGGKTIRELVRQNSDGELHVLSGKGIYISDGDSVLFQKDSSFSIKGTLVQWNIRLKNDQNNQSS